MAKKRRKPDVPQPWEPPTPLPKAHLLDHAETSMELNAKGEHFQRTRRSAEQSEDSDPDNKDYFNRIRFRSP